MNKILIIVPTYNSYNYLSKLIHSIDSQNSTRYRVLFVDGPSTQEHKTFIKKICEENSNYSYIDQSEPTERIYGAMNDGFKQAKDGEWVFFWGSDDWAASKYLFFNLLKIIDDDESIDLLVSKVAYVNQLDKVNRISSFKLFRDLRTSLFLGLTPPHQSTLFSPNVRRILKSYNTNYKISADLNYFLDLSKNKQLKVKLYDEVTVYLGDQGISAKETNNRLKEVLKAYKRNFKLFYFIPFIGRYIFRIIGILAWKIKIKIK